MRESEDPPPELLVRGARVGLGALRHDLIPHYLRWRSDPQTMRGQGRTDVATVESVTAWYEHAIKSSPSEVYFTVYDLDDLAPIGTTLLVDINHHAGTAEFGILIGDRRNQGLGTEATILTLDWAFTVLELYNVLLVTFSWNAAALRAYEKAGFHEIGRRRGAVLTLGDRFDHVLMDAIAPEFANSSIKSQLKSVTE